jgi:hypothetical protein
MLRICKDSYVAVALILLSLVALWGTRELNEMSAVFPKTVGIILLVLSIVYLIKSIKKPDYNKVFGSIDKGRVVPMLLGMVIYVALIWAVGFFLASLFFISFFVWFLQEPGNNRMHRLTRSGLYSIGMVLVFYLVFRYVFLVPLPEGIIFGG